MTNAKIGGPNPKGGNALASGVRCRLKIEMRMTSSADPCALEKGNMARAARPQSKTLAGPRRVRRGQAQDKTPG